MPGPFEEVEKYIFEAYLQNYESLAKEYKPSKDGAPYAVDGAKLQCLSTILELNVDKCYVGKSMLETVGYQLIYYQTARDAGCDIQIDLFKVQFQLDLLEIEHDLHVRWRPQEN